MSAIIMVHNIKKISKYSRQMEAISGGNRFWATTLRVIDKDGVKTEITLFSDDELVIEDEQF